MAARRTTNHFLQPLNILVLLLGIAGAVFGCGQWIAQTSYKTAETVATKAWVEEQMAILKKYTDSEIHAAFDKNWSHSDDNRKEMTLMMERSNGEIKLQLGIITTQISGMTDEMRRQDQARSVQNQIQKSARK